MKKIHSISVLFILAMFFLGACSDNKAEIPSPDNPVNYSVKGKVEKGPFVSGSTVTLQPLDQNLSPLGTIYTTKIKNDEGTFEFPTQAFTSPYAMLSTDGYFFNEVEGELSEGPIRLEALVDLSDNATVNVNLLTHLKVERLLKLSKDKLSFKEANQQAQKELLTCFGLQKYADIDASKFSITSGTDEAGALIVVSSALLDDRSEAELTEYLSKINQEFATNGRLSESAKKEYRETCLSLDLDEISNNIIKRYQSLNKEVTVKSLEYFIDWDNDGTAGNELGDDQGMKLEFEQDTLRVPAKGGKFTVKVNSNIPFTFDSFDIPPITEETFQILNIANIEFTKAIKEKEIVLTIFPTEAYAMNASDLKIYSYDGKKEAKLVLVQEGDTSKPLFSSDGLSMFTNLCSQLANATYYMHVMEALYTNTYQANNGRNDFEIHSLRSNDATINASWDNVYKTLTYSHFILGKLQNNESSKQFTPNISFLNATMYYETAVLWENIAYVENLSSDINLALVPQMSSSKIFKTIEKELSDKINRFKNGKNAFNKAEDYFFYSKDLPRVTLAKMYLYQKEYAKAKSLFAEIVADNHYQLSASREEAMKKNSSEMIWGYYNPTVNNPYLGFQPIKLDDFLPFATYTEVILSLAECEYRLGNMSQATDHLNQVALKRKLTLSSDFITSLKDVWCSELKGTGTYFAFLKRNGLAQKELNVEEYRLIFPIPTKEINTNPNFIQNPGY